MAGRHWRRLRLKPLINCGRMMLAAFETNTLPLLRDSIGCIWDKTYPRGETALEAYETSDLGYIRVTGNSIFQPDRYVGACIAWLTPSAPFIVYTKWRSSLEKPLHLYVNLKSLLSRKYCSLPFLFNSNRKKICEISPNVICFCDVKTNLHMELWLCKYGVMFLKLWNASNTAKTISLSLWRKKLQTWLCLCR